MDILLSDLTLEASLDKRIVILNRIRSLVDDIAVEMLVHSRRLLKAAQLTLLAPRAPSYVGHHSYFNSLSSHYLSTFPFLENGGL